MLIYRSSCFVSNEVTLTSFLSQHFSSQPPRVCMCPLHLVPPRFGWRVYHFSNIHHHHMERSWSLSWK